MVLADPLSRRLSTIDDIYLTFRPLLLQPEHFQRRMSALLKDLDGIVCLIGDVLIYGTTHSTRESWLNKAKCEFSKEVK